MLSRYVTPACALLASVAHVHAQSGGNATTAALNPALTNIIPNAPGGPTLYYNGSGPVPPYDALSPSPLPISPFNSTQQIEDNLFNELVGIVNGTSYSNQCDSCQAATELMHVAAITQPASTVINLLVRACEAFPGFQSTIYAATCYEEFNGIGNTGGYYVQLLAKMSAQTQDMQAFCWFYEACDVPPTIAIDESLYFSPKPDNASAVPASCGENINVLHFSDWHLDSRYDIGSEADCSQYLCCRPYSTNTKKHTGVSNATVPASRWGYLYCDAPPDLALSAFDTIPQFFNLSSVDFALFTGDIVSHDNDDQLSRAYVEYEETVVYQSFKAQLGDIPLYATLGNHDTLPEAFNSQNGLSNGSANDMSWNYELQSSLWSNSSWITPAEASYASTHYAGYAHTTAQGLRIISLNSDFWYVDNIFNYWNYTNPDTSGVLTWLAQELTACEAAGQPAWIIAHVLSGYDGSNALPNPSALLYSIVRRFSPSTIRGVFFGHTHEDQLQIFYDYLPNSSTTDSNGHVIRNTSLVDYSKPLQMGFIGPSITPLTGNNAGYQMYQVDKSSFQVSGIQTYFANVSESLTWSKPVWQFEYDARDTYNVNGSWPSSAPLNATFWDGVTYSMLSNQSLVETYNFLETKSSVVTKNCSTAACARQKVCYIRSGSAELGMACGSKAGPF